MKQSTFFLVFLTFLGCNISCKKSEFVSTGPIGQIVKSVKWVKTVMPSSTLTPYSQGHDEFMYVPSQYVYVVRRDSIVSVRKIIRVVDDVKNNSYTYSYPDNVSQTFDLIYVNNDRTRELKEVRIHAAYKGLYSAKADTVLSYFGEVGSIPRWIYDDEAKRQLNGG